MCINRQIRLALRNHFDTFVALFYIIRVLDQTIPLFQEKGKTDFFGKKKVVYDVVSV